ncbi:MAG: helix-turn-helix domain-containing protein [Hyphomicrobium sp.]
MHSTRRSDVRPQERPCSLNDEDAVQARHLHSAGASIRNISVQVGASRSTVHRLLKRA